MQTIMVCHGNQSFPGSTARLVSSAVDAEKSRDQGKLARVSARRSLLDAVANVEHSVNIGNGTVNTTRRSLKASAASNGNMSAGSWDYDWGGVTNLSLIYIHGQVGRVDEGEEVVGRIMVWLHEEAPKWGITIHCPVSPLARSSSIIALRARGWVLKISEMKQLGLPIDPNWFMDFEAPDNETLFEFDKMAAGADMPNIPTVSSGAGPVVVVPTPKHRRQIRPRRRT